MGKSAVAMPVVAIRVGTAKVATEESNGIQMLGETKIAVVEAAAVVARVMGRLVTSAAVGTMTTMRPKC